MAEGIVDEPNLALRAASSCESSCTVGATRTGEAIDAAAGAHAERTGDRRKRAIVAANRHKGAVVGAIGESSAVLVEAECAPVTVGAGVAVLAPVTA